MPPRIYLSPPHIGLQERELVQAAFDSNYIAPLGPMVDAFEREFASYTGIPHCVALSSGTAAMHLALRELGVGPGDEVLASTLTFIGSVNSAVYLGARLRFIDADAGTWNMDPELLAAELEDCARRGRLPEAVIPTDLYGQCANLPLIMQVCRKYEVPVVADAAEAMGSSYGTMGPKTRDQGQRTTDNGITSPSEILNSQLSTLNSACYRHAGYGADASVFSFNGNKIITTSGGGMLASHNKALIDHARKLSQQAREPAPHYEHTEIGYNYRMSNVLAAIGRGQLQVLNERVARKRRIFAWYQHHLGDLPGLEFMPEASYGRCNRWLTVVLIDAEVFGATNEQVRLALEGENIESRPVWKPMHLQPVFQGCPVRGGNISERLFAQGLCLPSGTAMTREDVERVCAIIARQCRPSFARSAAQISGLDLSCEIGRSRQNDKELEPKEPGGTNPMHALGKQNTGNGNGKPNENGSAPAGPGKSSASAASHPGTTLPSNTDQLPRRSIALLVRRGLLFILFSTVLLGCRWLAYELRFDFAVPEHYQVQLERHWNWVLAVQLLCLAIGGQFSGIYRYFSLPDLQRLGYSMLISGGVLYLVRFLDVGYSPPRGVILVQVVLGFLALAGLRTAWRMFYERVYSRNREVPVHERKVAIVGAGDAGSSLICELHAHPGLGLVPVALFDDNPRKWKSNVHGIPVAGPVAEIARLQPKYNFEEVIIAMPSVAQSRLAEVVSHLQKARIPHVTVPGIHQMTRGHVKITQLRPVRIEDLLGREPVEIKPAEISDVLKGKVVMVTGAGGSIGSELCRQIASFGPAQLLLVDQSEVQLFLIEQELLASFGGIIVPVIADILDKHRMRALLRQHRPAVIFHAAAHKHVSMMERQPSEAIKNNAFGTAILANLALKHGVERFVMISTDKAVNPTSVMGASKRMAEVYLQALARRHPGTTRFSAVRFGNVLGSSGSVVPIFEKQIAQGGPVTVTHPDVVRFFMTIPEAVGLVLQSCALGKGGEIFVLDMGQPVRIADLARQMIQLSGLEPGRDVEIQYVGLRPGEKLFEELHHMTANCTDTAHPRIKRLTNEPEPFEKVQAQFRKFEGWLHCVKADVIKRAMKEMLPEYQPHLSEAISPELELETPTTDPRPLTLDLRPLTSAGLSLSPLTAKSQSATPDRCWICGDFALCDDHVLFNSSVPRCGLERPTGSNGNGHGSSNGNGNGNGNGHAKPPTPKADL